jgi:hypothetical protein
MMKPGGKAEKHARFRPYRNVERGEIELAAIIVVVG